MLKYFKKLYFVVLPIILTVVIFSFFCLTYYLETKNVSNVIMERTITVTQNEIDYQGILNEFDNANLKTIGTITTFDGTKTIDIADLSQFDNLSNCISEKTNESIVKYNFTYDNNTNVVTITAEMKNDTGEIYIDKIEGVGFINSNNQIDAVMNIEGESVLLSEMTETNVINNCGWFSRLVKKVVKVAVVAVTTTAVVAATAAIIVATAGVAAPALVAAGVGITTSAATIASAGIGITAGALFYSTIGKAALNAGTAVAQSLGEYAEQLVDKTTGVILEIVYKEKHYTTAPLTQSIISTISKNTYFIAFANPNDGAMYYCPTAIDKNFAISIMAANTIVSVYTYYETNARSVAQQAGNNMSPIWERHHDYGYFDHYHLGNLSKEGEAHKDCRSHAFYGLPQFN